jgi:hypothetical protein
MSVELVVEAVVDAAVAIALAGSSVWSIGDRTRTCYPQ